MVETDLQDDLIVSVDGSQMKQVLINLLQNAVQATEPGEKISVRTKKEGEPALIEVADTGRGIPLEIQKSIFDPFFSTRERGLGLGLALCKRIIEEHRGRIEAQNSDEGGAMFRIYLPCSVAERAPSNSRQQGEG